MQRVLSVVLILVSAFLLFWRLGETPIWRDEATTAVWARGMAEHNALLPWTAYEDGQLMAQADDGHDVNSKMLPAMQSYLQFYVAALSFKLFGASELSARLPFALIGALTLFVFWRTGVVLFGPGLLALVPPGLASVSILFLHAARQGRYYILVGLFSSLVVYEVCRYLDDRTNGRDWSFHLRLAAWGLLLYFSNYVAFLGTWMSLGLWVLWQRDIALIRNFIATCAGMAVIVLADFFALHAEFAASWPPVTDPLLEIYQEKLTQRGRDIWRSVPLVFLVPAGLWLVWRRGATGAGWRFSAVIALAAVWSAFLTSQADWNAWTPALFWPLAAACLAAPAALFWGGMKTGFGKWGRAAVLGGLLLMVGPLITIALAKSKANTRHFYQMLPAAMLLSSLAVAGAARENKKAATVLFAGMALWPSLDLGFGGTEQLVWRQYSNDRSYMGPLIDAMKEHIQPGDRVGFLRNVKGMPAFFYRPDIRWVASLNVDVPHNAQFRDKLPADQFDDCNCADWYVIWDPRGTTPKGFSEEAFEKVWSHSYPTWLGWWDREKEPSVRTYELWKRVTP